MAIPSSPDPLLTYPEAAAYTSISLRQIKDWAQTGKVPVVKLGHRTRRIRRSDLDALIDASVKADVEASLNYLANADRAMRDLQAALDSAGYRDGGLGNLDDHRRLVNAARALRQVAAEIRERQGVSP